MGGNLFIEVLRVEGLAKSARQGSYTFHWSMGVCQKGGLYHPDKRSVGSDDALSSSLRLLLLFAMYTKGTIALCKQVTPTVESAGGVVQQK
eukprot:1362458-Amphidinium_carterae.1